MPDIDLGDQDSVRKRNTDLKRTAAIRAATVKAIMQHQHGRQFIYWLLTICRVNVNPFDTNALKMAFRSGEINIGQQVLAEVTVRENLELYNVMINEANENG